MTPKPVVPRVLARDDVESELHFYLREAGEAVALGFVDALEKAYRNIGRRPAAGSPHYGHELRFPGLRSWKLGKLPYLIFYIEQPDRIDIWRVLHAHRDIPRSLTAPED